MKKKELFFMCIFMICFLTCATVMTGDYLCKYLELKREDSRYFVEESVELEVSMAEEERNEQDVEKQRSDGMQSGNEQRMVQLDVKDEQTKEINIIESDCEREEQLCPSGVQNTKSETVPVVDAKENNVEEYQEAETVGYEYFEDALFIGDSRTVGLMEYGNIGNATFFADSGMSVFELDKKKISIPSEGKMGFDEVLTRKEYGKIYLMLGINELGYRFENIQERYKETVERIKESQGNAIIYLCANMHVTEEQSQKDEIYNNQNVNRVNEMISGLADNERIFYIDVNERFDDESGSLSTEYSSDSFHVYGKYYMDWVDWLCTKVVKKPEKS